MCHTSQINFLNGTAIFTNSQLLSCGFGFFKPKLKSNLKAILEYILIISFMSTNNFTAQLHLWLTSPSFRGVLLFDWGLHCFLLQLLRGLVGRYGLRGGRSVRVRLEPPGRRRCCGGRAFTCRPTPRAARLLWRLFAFHFNFLETEILLMELGNYLKKRNLGRYILSNYQPKHEGERTPYRWKAYSSIAPTFRKRLWGDSVKLLKINNDKTLLMVILGRKIVETHCVLIIHRPIVLEDIVSVEDLLVVALQYGADALALGEAHTTGHLRPLALCWTYFKTTCWTIRNRKHVKKTWIS